MKFINAKFKHRHYPKHLTDTPPISFSHRTDHIITKSHKATSNNRNTLITTFDPICFPKK